MIKDDEESKIRARRGIATSSDPLLRDSVVKVILLSRISLAGDLKKQEQSR